MKCEEGHKLDLVEYLFSLGFTPTKIIGNNYWYISPFRNEKEPSFKIDRNKNVWYDHGAGKGGTVVDFVMQYFNCDVSRALQKLSFYQHIPQKQFISKEIPGSIVLPEVHQQELFDEKNNIINTERINQQRPPFRLRENSLINHRDAAETALEIIAAKQPITDMVLCRYLKQRRINKTVADKYCQEVIFKFGYKNVEHVAIGFKNSAGGYELRSKDSEAGYSLATVERNIYALNRLKTDHEFFGHINKNTTLKSLSNITGNVTLNPNKDSIGQ